MRVFFSCTTGGERVEEIEQQQQVGRRRGRRRFIRRRGRRSQRRRAGKIPEVGTAHGPPDPDAERGAKELGPGETEVVSGEGESVVLPETAADELRADVPEDAGVRGADREPHGPDERVLGPLRRRGRCRRSRGRDQERRQKGRRGQNR